MCMLLKLDYAKFGESNLFFFNVIEEKPFGGLLEPPPGKGRVNSLIGDNWNSGNDNSKLASLPNLSQLFAKLSQSWFYSFLKLMVLQMLNI